MSAKSPKSQGYHKLAGAARAFGYDFRGKTVLDIGSSTGGFTKAALDAGAKRVVAVEKGTRQMMAPLRFDARVELHEKNDIFDFKISKDVNVAVADVSFTSIKPILKHIRPQLPPDVDYLIMLKPQFEARPDQLRQGIIKNEKIRRAIIKNFELWLRQNDFVIISKRDNQIRGKNGNLERFYWLKNVQKS